MALSVYVHIPYCLQRCHYCDFTTFEQTEILPPERYVQLVIQEIRNRHSFWREREIATVYFGGGTPSLIAPELIVAIYRELANVGFIFRSDCETTIEINPATLNEQKLDFYLEAGVNRFSVGAQTFNEELLRKCRRKHSADDTRETLRLLLGRERGLNFSFDLLFALPGQTRADLVRDLDEVAHFSPPHLSAYCLTVPDAHPMTHGRPPEGEQIEMFQVIEDRLKAIGVFKYEISNFSRPGIESRHNQVYWCDKSYWGLGLSSHSYQRDGGVSAPMGVRFWNPKSIPAYAYQIGKCGNRPDLVLPSEQYEILRIHEALTDYCHMFLRTTSGLLDSAMSLKFSQGVFESCVLPRLQSLRKQGLLANFAGHWKLTPAGALLSNRVFAELTFLEHELGPSTLTCSGTSPYCAV